MAHNKKQIDQFTTLFKEASQALYFALTKQAPPDQLKS